MQARSLFVQEEALRQLEAAGDTENASILRGQMEGVRARLERRYGDVLQ